MSYITIQLASALSLAIWLAGLLLLPSAAPAQEDLEALEEQAMKDAVASRQGRADRNGRRTGTVGRVLVGTGPTTGLAVSEDGYVISSAFNSASSRRRSSSPCQRQAGGRRDGGARPQPHAGPAEGEHDREAAPCRAVPRNEMRVGQWAIAVGRTFEGDQPNMSVGVLSALDRIWGKAIQTDAKVSPNNYGGPLVDIRGRVLGVLVPLSPQGHDEVAGVEWYDSGIGFADPAGRDPALPGPHEEGRGAEARASWA